MELFFSSLVIAGMLLAMYPAMQAISRWLDADRQNRQELHEQQLAALRKYVKEPWHNEYTRLIAEDIATRKRVTRHATNPMRFKQPGYVYLIRAENGRYKIGQSEDPRARFLNLQAASPVQLAILHLIPTNHMNALEQQLHDTYAEVRTHGEWFDLNDAHVQEIIAMQEPVMYDNTPRNN